MAHDSNSPYNAATHEGQSADDIAAHVATKAAAVAQSAADMQSALTAYPLKSNNLSDMTASTMRTNLGLGSVDNTSDATKNIGRVENKASLRDFFAALYGFYSSPSATRVGIGYYGDSVAPQVPEAMCRLLNQESFPRCDLQYPAALNAALTVTTSGTALTYDGPNISDGSGALDFTYLPSAKHITLASGSVITYDTANARGYNEGRVYFVTGPGFGSVTVDLMNGASVVSTQTISLSAGSIGATKVAFTGLTKSITYKMRVTATGSAVVLSAIFLKPYGVFAFSLARGGSTLTQNNTSNETIFRYLISDLNIKLLGMEVKEPLGSPIATAIARLGNVPLCSVIVFGSFPNSGDQAAQIATNAEYRTQALANDLAYFDCYALFGSYTELTRLGWNNDGTHPAQAAHDYAGSCVMSDFASMFSALGSRICATVDHRGTTNYLASKSINVFKGDDSEDLIEVIATAGGGAPGQATLKNVYRVYFDSDGSLLAFLTGRDTTSVQVLAAGGGWANMYLKGIESPDSGDYVVSVANGGGYFGKFVNSGTGFRHGTSGPTWTSGTGTPEGSKTAVVGSLFSRTDGGASTTLYVKQSGTGNTGWVAK